MRVLHIITGLASGGAERQLALLLPRLPCTCDVVTLTRPGVVATALAKDGIGVRDLGMRGNRDLTAIPRLARVIRAGRYDLVHTHLYRATVYGRVAARLAGVRHVVSTEHSIGDALMEGRPKSASVRALYLAAERLGDTTIAVSSTVAERLVAWGVPRSRVVVISNGIDADRLRYDPRARSRVRAELGLTPDQRVVGSVGRLEPTKRFDILLRAAAGLDATVLLVGDGSARRDLEEMARSLGIADRTVFAGESEDVAGMLSAMDAFAAPSPEEAFGLSVVEALASGLPVVYNACPALEDVVADESLRAPGAHRVPLTADRFRDELESCLLRPGERLALPGIAEHYAAARLAARIATLYEQVLGGGTVEGDRTAACLLSGTPLSGTPLSGTPLSGKQLSGTPFSGEQFSGAQPGEARCSAPRPPRAPEDNGAPLTPRTSGVPRTRRGRAPSVHMSHPKEQDV